MKSLLELSNIEATNFFLKQESYCSIDLPVYFSFQPLIDAVALSIDGSKLSDFYDTYFDVDKNKDKPKLPCKYDEVNHILLNNKDGKYAWRPFQLIHPALYVDLVNKLTSSDNWTFAKSRFEEFAQNERIKCLSIPVESEDDKTSNMAALVSQWWLEIEQQSIELGLDYEFILHTDISNCYGAFYTHSIAWALHGRAEAKEKRNDNNLLGNAIDISIRDMTNGQTNGIPQGSVLMDFVAEMILGYADLRLSECISEMGICDYRILRYRDDFRIFTNNPQETDVIVKSLTEVLIELGLKLNSAKTIASSNVVRDSLKPDKQYWITNKQYSKNLQKELFIIQSLAEKYPNSGVLTKAILGFYDRISKIENTSQQLPVLISIVVDIMLHSPRVYPIAAAVLSKLISLQENNEVKRNTINRIIKRFDKVPNTSYLEIWMQRMSKFLHDNISFKEKLCRRLNDSSITIWNSEWLNESFKSLIDTHPIIDTNELEKLDSVINRSEVELFRSVYLES